MLGVGDRRLVSSLSLSLCYLHYYEEKEITARHKERIPTAEQEKRRSKLRLTKDEPTWRCHQNPFIGALGIQEPVMPGEPLIEG